MFWVFFINEGAEAPLLSLSGEHFFDTLVQ